ncbi:MAG: hypothetical protein RLZZ555_2138, partial [Pseudomonadota bacterium]
GPRPGAPKLVEGPAISRSSGRAIRAPRDHGQHDDQAPQGYIGADASPRGRKGPGLYGGGKSGRPGSPGGQGGPRKGPRR